ncbi:hypothetical protein NEMIN01_1245 [Nematocida minor]|uniref:uncharacterized protein n=1 Tax=Nematocida minor TaxID=1912983 RepID=UPI00221FA3A8|nr:uncharacterized protein NEMIN01_1245 [Nematocida minor]KAI5190843.1 hypothetical protein NEMIN01_1245 [Nematocida minor]
MRASDFFKEPKIKMSKDGAEEYEMPSSQSQEEWACLAKQFLSNVSYAEQNIQTEAHLEIARKELQEKGIIKQEKIEQKTYSGATCTLKPAILREISKRLGDVANTMKELEKEEDKKRYIISFFENKEFVKRKDRDLVVHISDKLFLSLAAIQKGTEESYIEGILFIGGVEHRGYIIEKKIEQFEILSNESKTLNIHCSSADTEVLGKLANAIHEYRDRVNSTEIIKEYATQAERAKVQRVFQKPPVQSKHIVFLLCALKQGLSFETAVALIKTRA